MQCQLQSAVSACAKTRVLQHIPPSVNWSQASLVPPSTLAPHVCVQGTESYQILLLCACPPTPPASLPLWMRAALGPAPRPHWARQGRRQTPPPAQCPLHCLHGTYMAHKTVQRSGRELACMGRHGPGLIEQKQEGLQQHCMWHMTKGVGTGAQFPPCSTALSPSPPTHQCPPQRATPCPAAGPGAGGLHSCHSRPSAAP